MSFWRVERKETPAEPRVALVVDDDASIHDQVRDALADFGWDFLFADDKAGAIRLLDREPPLVAALVDLYFPEDAVATADAVTSTGLGILTEVRRRYPRLPCAALTGGLRQHHINEVGKLGATYLSKWELATYLPSFATNALIATATSDEALRRCVAAYAAKFRLSPRETVVVALAAADVARGDLPRHTGTGNPTVKTQIRSILAKTEAKTIEAIGRTLRLQARAGEEAMGGAQAKGRG